MLNYVNEISVQKQREQKRLESEAKALAEIEEEKKRLENERVKRAEERAKRQAQLDAEMLKSEQLLGKCLYKISYSCTAILHMNCECMDILVLAVNRFKLKLPTIHNTSIWR